MVTGGAGPSYMAAESHLAAVSYCPVAAIAVRLPRRSEETRSVTGVLAGPSAYDKMNMHMHMSLLRRV